MAGYGEAQAFRLLNERLLLEAGAAWDEVDSFLDKRAKQDFAEACLNRIQRATFGALKTEFLDLRPEACRGPWGWKDPVNSLTLPYWLKIFPEARIIHVIRNPNDVADSLIRRARSHQAQVPPTILERARRWVRTPAAAARGIGRRLHTLAQPSAPRRSVLSRDYCLHLYSSYVSECLRYRDLGRQYQEIHFEDILLNPAAVTRNLADFAERPLTQSTIEAAVAFVDTDGLPTHGDTMVRVACGH